MSALVAALRISRRDALRAKGRSALIMSMIGLPVLVITALFTGLATSEVDDREGLTGQLGRADARITTTATRGAIEQSPSGIGLSFLNGPNASAIPWTEAEVAELLGPGARLVASNDGSVDVGATTDVGAIEVDLRDPLTQGMRELVEGRLPATLTEVAVTPATGHRVGERLQLTRLGRSVLVVGVLRHANYPARTELVGLPGALLLGRDGAQDAAWLADTAGPVAWADVRRLNGSGLLVRSRAVINDPPPVARDDLVDDSTSVVVGTGVGVVMVVLEVVLLAGPAFAVGLRRRRGELAVVAAQGGSGAHLRAIVLADGFVLGGMATLPATVVGVAVGVVGAPLPGWSIGPPDVPWWPVLGVAALGLLSGVVAALVPAVQAARQSTSAILAGRPATARDRAGLPVLGLVLLGLVALTPWLVGFTGRAAVRLPLPLRLPVRDASRHRARTASAVAAVMTATTAVIALGIALNSNYADNWEAYQAATPIGTVTIAGRDLDDQGWARLRAAAAQRLPDRAQITAHEPVGLAALRIECPSDRCGLERVAIPTGDGRLLSLVQGRQDTRAAAAFAAGEVVVFHPSLLKDGRVTLTVRLEGEGRLRTFEAPAVAAVAADPRQAVAVVPVSAIRAAGLPVHERRLYVADGRSALPASTPSDESSYYAAFRNANLLSQQLGEGVRVDVEQGFAQDSIVGQLWILLGAALILVLGGTLVATGLASADMRPDLATMSAVGARARTNRLVLAGHAAYVAGLGALVGVLAGAVTGVALTWPMTVPHSSALYRPGLFGLPTEVPTVAIPWLFVAGVVVGLPLLAALVAGVFTRVRIPLARRLS